MLRAKYHVAGSLRSKGTRTQVRGYKRNEFEDKARNLKKM